jgi:folylpolyglutamate synthase/dihydropteroate synthase
VIATRPNNPRAASPQEIQLAATRTGIQVELIEDVGNALKRARELNSEDSVLVITGSIYLVGEAMQLLGVKPEQRDRDRFPLK